MKRMLSERREEKVGISKKKNMRKREGRSSLRKLSESALKPSAIAGLMGHAFQRRRGREGGEETKFGGGGGENTESKKGREDQK